MFRHYAIITVSNQTIVFIMGRDTGLGYQTVKSLYKSAKPYHIILGCHWIIAGEEG